MAEEEESVVEPTHPTTVGSTVAFVDATVLPMDSDRILADYTVVTANGRIAAMGPSVSTPAPPEALVVDARERFLMPGLSEMHGHIPNALEQREYAENVLLLYVSAGVTTVRGMQGRPGQLELRDEINDGGLLGPSLYLAGPGLTEDPAIAAKLGIPVVDSTEDATIRVRQQADEGWDYVKIFPGVTVEAYDEVARVAREVGLPLVGHVPMAVGVQHALSMRQQTIDHIDGYIEALGGTSAPIDLDRLGHLIEATVRAGTWIVPTMYAWETIFGAVSLESETGRPELRYMPRHVVEQWMNFVRDRLASPSYDNMTMTQFNANRQHLLGLMQRRGVRIILGTDAPQVFNVPGFSVSREMRLMADAGLAPYEVLRSGTAAAGEYISDPDDPFGKVAVGQRADLILACANPLEDVANVERLEGVMVRGHWRPKSEIQTSLDRLAAANARV